MRAFVPFLFLLCTSWAQVFGYGNAPTCCWYNGVEVGAEWLYWQAEQTQMEIGAEIMSQSSGGGLSIHPELLRPGYNFRSGFRVNAAYDFCGSCWSIGAAYTHSPSHAKVSAINDPADIDLNFVSIFATNFPLLTAFADVNLSSLVADWQLDLDYLDLTLQRNYFPCRCLVITPYFGARGFWMRQNYDIDGASPLNGGSTFSAKMSERFNGYGLTGGLEAEWRIACGFAFVGRFGGSLLYSTVRFVGSVDALQGAMPLNIDIRDRVYRSTPAVGTFVALRYATTCCCRTLQAYLGWENNLYFHTNQFNITSQGSLTAQGLTLGAALGF